MVRPLVSVVMPSYNHAEYVGRAIESVLNQTYDNFEMIIVDDASTDNSVEVISQYKDERIRFIPLEKNKGFSASVLAWNMVKGKYLSAICSDDMWDKCFLEKNVQFMESHAEYGCCFSKPIVIDKNDNELSDSVYNGVFNVSYDTKEEWFRELYLHGNCLCAPSSFMRKRVYDQYGPYRFQYRQLQDYDFWLRMTQTENIYIHQEKLIKYRRHLGGENHNISAPTLEIQLRDKMERSYLLLDIIDNLDNDYFIRAFKQDLIKQPDEDGFCVECEKFNIILSSAVAPEEVPIFYYFKQYNNETFRKHIEEDYAVTRKDFWDMTGADYNGVGDANSNKILLRNLSQILGHSEQQINEKIQ